MTTAPEAYSRPTGGAVGMDVGVKTAAVVATAGGTPAATLEASRALRGALAHIKDLQRALSRTQKGSANRARARRRLGRARPTPGRAQYAPAGSTSSPPSSPPGHGLIVVENIATANLMPQPPPGPGLRRPGLGRAVPPARLQDHPARWHPRGRRPVVPLKYDVLGLRGSETQAVPGRAHLPLRAVRPGHRPGRERRREPRRPGRATTGHPAPRLTSRAGDRHPGGPSAQNAEHACAGSNEPVTMTVGAPVEAGTSRPRPRVAQALDCPRQGQLRDVGGASHLTHIVTGGAGSDAAHLC
jgi:putative transposase